MIKIVIVDDCKEALSFYKNSINELIHTKKINLEIVSCSDNPTSLIEFLQHDHADIFLLDIDLKNDINGLQLAQIIKEKIKNAYIIFASGHGELVFKSFRVHPFDFLVKPVDQHRLQFAVLNAYNDIIENKTNIAYNKTLTLKQRSNIYNVKISNLIYMEKTGKHLSIYSIDSIIMCNCLMNEVEQMLVEKGIEDVVVRVHKSYFININFIEVIDSRNKIVKMTTGQQIPIGRAYKDNLKCL